jgi:hypothetical protein
MKKVPDELIEPSFIYEETSDCLDPSLLLVPTYGVFSFRFLYASSESKEELLCTILFPSTAFQTTTYLI